MRVWQENSVGVLFLGQYSKPVVSAGSFFEINIHIKAFWIIEGITHSNTEWVTFYVMPEVKVISLLN